MACSLAPAYFHHWRSKARICWSRSDGPPCGGTAATSRALAASMTASSELLRRITGSNYWVELLGRITGSNYWVELLGSNCHVDCYVDLLHRLGPALRRRTTPHARR